MTKTVVGCGRSDISAKRRATKKCLDVLFFTGKENLAVL
jgi:hypothetical protein